MNLKLLTKLVKLANNNPNENEANLAARKVCKIIEESQFKFVPDAEPVTYKQPVTPPGTYSGFSNPPDNPFTWSTSEVNKGEVYESIKDFIRKAQAAGRDHFYRAPYNPFETPQWNTSPNKDDEKYYTRRKERGFGDTKRNLTCSKCNQKKETIFIGLEEVFICNECQWNAVREKF